MTFIVRASVANMAAVNAAIQAAGGGPDNLRTPVFTTGAQPAFAVMHHMANAPALQAACQAIPNATVEVLGTLAVGMDATATAIGGRWGGNAPLLQGNVTPGLYRAIPADGGALWTVVQAFNRAVVTNPLADIPALVRKAKEPGVVQPWVQPFDQFDSYQAVNPFTGLPDRVSHLGKEWDCLIANNVNVPGVTNWRQFVTTGYPAWLQPLGAGDVYPVGFRVTHLGQNWENNSPNNASEPGVFGWVII